MNEKDNHSEKENDSPNPQDIRDCHRALQVAIIGICQKQDVLTSSRTSSGALVALSELAYQYATKVLAPDLDYFAQHASRRTINEQDVKLVVRRHPSILTKLENKLRELGNLQQDSTNCSISNERKKIAKIDLQRKNKRKSVELVVSHFEDSDASSSTDEELVFDQCFSRKSFGDTSSTSITGLRNEDKTNKYGAASIHGRTQVKAYLHDVVDSSSELSETDNFQATLSSDKKKICHMNRKGRFRLPQNRECRLSKDPVVDDDETKNSETKASRIQSIMESTLSQGSNTDVSTCFGRTPR